MANDQTLWMVAARGAPVFSGDFTDATCGAIIIRCDFADAACGASVMSASASASETSLTVIKIVETTWRLSTA